MTACADRCCGMGRVLGHFATLAMLWLTQPFWKAAFDYPPVGNPESPDPDDPIVLQLYDPVLCATLLAEWGMGPLLTQSAFSVVTPDVLVDALTSNHFNLVPDV